MKTKLLTCVSTLDKPGIKKLEHSLKLFGYDYEIIHEPTIDWAWAGWHCFQRWCRDNKDNYTHFVYMDGFDTLALGGMEEIEKKYKEISPDLKAMVYSAEKACYPTCDQPGYPTPDNYPVSGSRWNFLNAGQFIAPLDKFISLNDKIDLRINCQHWGHQQFLWHNDGTIKLDTNCEIFQSCAFGGEGDLEVKELNGQKRLYNPFTNTYPVMAHGNGMANNMAEFQFVYNILGL